MRNSKVIFIGAGVGNLLAANYLLRHGVKDFVILEKGKDLKQRSCPCSEKYHCQNCSSCSVTDGVGGANALNGNKICHFPASSGVVDFVGEDMVKPALNFISSFSSIISKEHHERKQGENHLKYYQSDILIRSDFADLIHNLTKDISDYIQRGVEVLKVSTLSKEHFRVHTQSEIYETNNIVFGTGRSSYSFLSQYLLENKYECRQLSQDVGIRIEGPRKLFSSKYYYQVDPKLKFVYSNGIGRTFCAHNQGLVVPVKMGDSYYADGAFGNLSSEFNNIALMVRSNLPLTGARLEKWAKQINNSSSNGLLLGVVRVTSPKETICQIFKVINVFPSSVHADLFERLLNDLFIGEQSILDFSNSTGLELRIYGPAIDRYWVRPILNSDFSIKNNKNVYIIGDAAGLSRGFLQAMFSGYAWANSFLSKTKQIHTDNDKIWCCGVSPGLLFDSVQER